MSSKTINISLPKHLYDFLEENKSIPRSKLFQQAVENIQNTLRSNPQLIEANKLINQLQKSKEITQRELQRATTFIENKKLWKEYEKSA